MDKHAPNNCICSRRAVAITGHLQQVQIRCTEAVSHDGLCGIRGPIAATAEGAVRLWNLQTAASDLLEACRYALSYLVANPDGYSNPRADAIRAAITKAETK